MVILLLNVIRLAGNKMFLLLNMINKDSMSSLFFIFVQSFHFRLQKTRDAYQLFGVHLFFFLFDC